MARRLAGERVPQDGRRCDMSDNTNHPEAFGIWSKTDRYWMVIFRNREDAEKRAAQYCDANSVDVVNLIPEPNVERMIAAAVCEESVKVQIAEQRGRDAERERIIRKLRDIEPAVPNLLAKAASDYVLAKAIESLRIPEQSNGGGGT